MDYKHKIIKELQTISQKEAIENNFFKVRAYQKVIGQLEKLDGITSMDDLSNIEGIGVKIKAKIEEIFKTGQLTSAERVRAIKENGKSKIEIYQIFLQIYGVGIQKAKEIVDIYKIKTIDELQQAINEGKDILNAKQKIGLTYYVDIQERIPANEIEKHYRKINNVLKSEYPEIEVKVVGSYRRKSSDSGDIDILIKPLSDKTDIKKMLERIILLLKKVDKKGNSYLVADLSSGSRKYMGICKLNDKSKARRIDILITTPQEYPFALVYFTGDFDINISLRKEAKELGYTLNEYKLTPISSSTPNVDLKTEKDIFNFLGFKFLQPKDRNIQNLKKLD